MHPEVELKFKVSGFEELRERLADAGAVLEQAAAPESNTILDDEGGSLGNSGSCSASGSTPARSFSL